jgi:hypothetical protein
MWGRLQHIGGELGMHLTQVHTQFPEIHPVRGKFPTLVTGRPGPYMLKPAPHSGKPQTVAAG